MTNVARKWFPQPAVAATTTVASLAVLVVVWLNYPVPASAGSAYKDTMLALILAAGALFAYHLPVHLRLSDKAYLCGAVFFLMAVLLPVPLAVLAVGLSCLAGEVSVRSRTGNHPSDIAAIASRASLVAAGTSVIAHLPVPMSDARPLVFVAAGVTMWTLVHLTSPLIQYPLTRESPVQIVVEMVKERGLIEACQLLIGLLGVVAAVQELWSLALLLLPAGLVYISFKRAKDLDDGTRKTLEIIADAVDLRDPWTGGHGRRVSEYAKGIMRELCTEGPEVDLIVWAARVHDIGKVGIPDDILRKAGPLTPEERTVMESHAERGADMLRRYPQFDRGMDIIRHHHERWGSGGYPYRLRETAIPFGSRVIAVADSYDAMTSDRPHRRGMTPLQAAAILREGRGTQWEGTLVDAFLRSISHVLEAETDRGLHLVAPIVDDSATA